MFDISSMFSVEFLASTLGAMFAVSVSGFSTFLHKILAVKTARSLADEQKFNEALASSDLITLGNMLRDRFGTVSVEALLDDRETQDRVFKSLERLTEIVNQPFSEKEEEPVVSSTGEKQQNVNPAELLKLSSPSEFASAGIRKKIFLDFQNQNTRSHLAQNISKIADRADNRLLNSEIWTALAGARRDLETMLSNETSEHRRILLSPRIFLDPQLRGAMQNFLSIANRAIHGANTSREDAEEAIQSLRFIAQKLPNIVGNNQN